MPKYRCKNLKMNVIEYWHMSTCDYIQYTVWKFGYGHERHVRVALRVWTKVTSTYCPYWGDPGINNLQQLYTLAHSCCGEQLCWTVCKHQSFLQKSLEMLSLTRQLFVYCLLKGSAKHCRGSRRAMIFWSGHDSKIMHIRYYIDYMDIEYNAHGKY